MISHVLCSGTASSNHAPRCSGLASSTARSRTIISTLKPRRDHTPPALRSVINVSLSFKLSDTSALPQSNVAAVRACSARFGSRASATDSCRFLCGDAKASQIQALHTSRYKWDTGCSCQASQLDPSILCSSKFQVMQLKLGFSLTVIGAMFVHAAPAGNGVSVDSTCRLYLSICA
jgi:hypothetical protein